MNEEKMKKTALTGACAAAILFFLWTAMRFLLPVLIPFCIAYAISLAVKPPAAYLKKKTGIPRGIWASLIIVILSFLLVFFTVKAGRIILKEGTDALYSLGKMLEDENSTLSRFVQKISRFTEGISFGKTELSLDVKQIFSALISHLAAWMTEGAADLVSKMPAFLFSFAVGVIALFYFSLDPKGVRCQAEKLLPKKSVSALSRICSAARRALGRFIKAYLVIMTMTFFELLVGLSVIGMPYPFLLSAIIALIDILPVLGVGSVLVPWSLLLFAGGNGGQGGALLALFFIMYALRQLAEPRIVGNISGFHPLLALVFVYGGFKLGGVGGMLAGPLILYGVSVFWEEKS